MNGAGRVAVVIPCFNGARFVGEAIQSALHQTYASREIVVVNDGSTDGFSEAVAPFRGRIRVIDQENAGLARARNRGLDETESEFIAFLDADDRWHPEKIARQVAALEAQPDHALCYTRRRLIDGAGDLLSRHGDAVVTLPEGRCVPSLVARNPMVPSSVVIRRSHLGSERFVAEACGCEDWDLWLRLAEQAPIVLINDALTDYRIHGANMSSSAELMHTGVCVTLERAIARTRSRDVRRIAREHRRRVLLSSAGLAYERGDFARSRALFLQAWPSASPSAWIRFAATFLPTSAYPNIRRMWRTLRSA